MLLPVLLLSLLLQFVQCNLPKINIVQNAVAMDMNAFYDNPGLLSTLNNLTQVILSQTSNRIGLNEKSCVNSLMQYANGLVKKDEWALQMFDATAKLQSGILRGNIYNVGSYDECVSIKSRIKTMDAKDFSILGKYCLGTLTIPVPRTSSELILYWGLCLPHECNANDINYFTQMLSLKFSDAQCHSHDQDPKIEGGDIAIIAFFGLIFALLALSTFYEVYLNYSNKRTAHPLLVSFSVITNGRKLIHMKKVKNPDHLQCLSGMRTLSMMWIIYCHMYTCLLSVGLQNYTMIQDFYKDNATMYVRGATVSVDSFFLMSGIVMVYVYLNSTRNKSGLGFNIFKYYLHRYLRLTPSFGAIILVHVGLLKHFGEGPFWHTIYAYDIDSCKKYWWSALLYIQNYVNPDEICVGQSWYLTVDTQLFLLSPLVLVLLKKWPKVALALILLGSLASMASSFAMAWIYELKDLNNVGQTLEETRNYMKYFYTATYTRASPWLIGSAIGYVIFQIKKGNWRLKINTIGNLLAWAASLSVLLCCLFYDFGDLEYTRGSTSSYIAFMRPAWAVALSWVIVACVTGYGGPINDFLSLPVFQLVARLSYSMYIVHLTTLTTIFFAHKEPIYFTQAQMAFDYWSFFSLVLFLSILWSLAFESPVIILEKSLLGGKKLQTTNEVDQKTELDLKIHNLSNSFIPRVNSNNMSNKV